MGIEVRTVGTLEDAQVLVLASDHGGRRGQQLEVGRRQRGRPIGGRQRLVGIRPPTAGIRAPASPDVAGPALLAVGAGVSRSLGGWHEDTLTVHNLRCSDGSPYCSSVMETP